MGRTDKPLNELTDSELEDELLLRRRERASRRSRGKVAPKGTPESPLRMQVKQWYANLELAEGASLEEVRRAYRELMRKYHPDKHVDDPNRHRAATELAQSLTQAYKALSEHLDQ